MERHVLRADGHRGPCAAGWCTPTPTNWTAAAASASASPARCAGPRSSSSATSLCPPLDVSIQAQILNLLQDLQRGESSSPTSSSPTTCPWSSTSPTRSSTMYVGSHRGERAPRDDLFAKPAAPLHQGASLRHPHPQHRRRAQAHRPAGRDRPPPSDPKPGCRFANRCPYANDICRVRQPEFEEVEPEHFVAGRFTREINGSDMKKRRFFSAAAGLLTAALMLYRSLSSRHGRGIGRRGPHHRG